MTNRAQAGVSSVFHRAGVHDRAGLHLGLRPLREHSAGGCLALRHHAGRGGHSCPRPLGVPAPGGQGPVPRPRGDGSVGHLPLGVGEIPLLFGGALLVLLVRIVQHRWEDRGRVASVTLLGTPLGLLTLLSAGSGPRRKKRLVPAATSRDLPGLTWRGYVL